MYVQHDSALKLFTWSLQNSLMSSSVAVCPGFSLIQAQSSSPSLLSGTPITYNKTQGSNAHL